MESAGERNLSRSGADRGHRSAPIRSYGFSVGGGWLRRAGCHLLDFGELLFRQIDACARLGFVDVFMQIRRRVRPLPLLGIDEPHDVIHLRVHLSEVALDQLIGTLLGRIQIPQVEVGDRVVVVRLREIDGV